MKKLVLLGIFIFGISIFATTEIKESEMRNQSNKKKMYNNELMNGDYLIEKSVATKYEYDSATLDKLNEERKEVEAKYQDLKDVAERYKKIIEEEKAIDKRYLDKYKPKQVFNTRNIYLASGEILKPVVKYEEYNYSNGEIKYLKALYDENKKVVLQNITIDGINTAEIYSNGKLYARYSLLANNPKEFNYLNYIGTCSESKLENNKCLNGNYELYYSSGKIKETGKYKPATYTYKNQEREDSYQDGVIKSYYENGSIQSEVNYTEGVKNGSAKFYKENGQLEKEIVYTNGEDLSNLEKIDTIEEKEIKIIKGLSYFHDILLNGTYYSKYSYAKEGEYKSVITERVLKYKAVYTLVTYEKGLLKETNNTYGENKNLIFEYKWNDDSVERTVYKDSKVYEKFQSKIKGKFRNMIEGPYEMYYDNGKLMEKGAYKVFKYKGGIQSLEEGLILKYYENGNLKEESNYSNGDKNGASKLYYENGNLKKEVIFKDNINVEEAVNYDEKGNKVN